MCDASGRFRGVTMASVNETMKRDVRSPAPVDQIEIDTLMRRFFDQNRLQDTESPAPASIVRTAAHDASPRRDFDMATELLDRASQAFELLINRCQRLERDLDETNERAQARVVEQEQTTEQWKRLASGLKAQAERSEQAVASLKVRCDAAEARADMAEQKASALERASIQAAGQTAEAESLSTKLHDKVVAAFGIGSRAHPVLEAVATQAAAE